MRTEKDECEHNDGRKGDHRQRPEENAEEQTGGECNNRQHRHGSSISLMMAYLYARALAGDSSLMSKPTEVFRFFAGYSLRSGRSVLIERCDLS